MPPITKEVLVGTLLIGYVRCCCEQRSLLELKFLSFVSAPELALTPESRSNFLPRNGPSIWLLPLTPMRLTWVCPCPTH
jgi:hypothetical protein